MAGGIIGHTLYKGRSSSVPINGYGKDRTKIRLHCLFCAYLINAQVWHVLSMKMTLFYPSAINSGAARAFEGSVPGGTPRGDTLDAKLLQLSPTIEIIHNTGENQCCCPRGKSLSSRTNLQVLVLVLGPLVLDKITGEN